MSLQLKKDSPHDFGSVFPILRSNIRGKRLVYLDNAATTLKPQSVVDTISEHYLMGASNIHRGVHFLSEQATEKYESARSKIAEFIHARSRDEIIFTSGTTASINFTALSLGQFFFKSGDEIIITHMEHHSNIVPWQMLREKFEVVLKVVPISDSGELDLAVFESMVTQKTKMVSCVHYSNSLGTINPIKKIIQIAKSAGALTLIDAAQSVAHTPINVQELECDFLVFSGHKMFGPTGIGVLYGRKEILEKMPPVFGGGDMISSVTFEKTIYNHLPHRLEAGTPPIAEVIGLGAALDFINSVGFDFIQSHEKSILNFATAELSKIDGVKIIGTAKNKSAVISFTLRDIHPHDIGTFLDQDGIAIRTGHHCTQPVMDRFGIPATARASFSIYNTEDDVRILVDAVKNVLKFFSS